MYLVATNSMGCPFPPPSFDSVNNVLNCAAVVTDESDAAIS